tara:strand:- start:13857 stop:14687 length:831 start_codon:yes stop_codon:yes gene_type:complete
MISVQLTNGFGNNIFQYVAARLLAEHHDQEWSLVPPTPDYYAITSLENLGLKCEGRHHPGATQFNDNNYKSAYDSRFKDADIHLSGYFEDYRYYINHLDRIKSWFPKEPITNFKDLVVHFRTGDTLIQCNNFAHKPSPERWTNVFKKFDFDRLHIVSDFPRWSHITKNELEELKGFHNPNPGQLVKDKQQSVDYINSCIDEFARFDPVFVHGDIDNDFNYLRKFDKLVFQHGTLGWWAGALSNASTVGVYGPWRPWKGTKNKNLGQAPIPGWFKWS